MVEHKTIQMKSAPDQRLARFTDWGTSNRCGVCKASTHKKIPRGIKGKGALVRLNQTGGSEPPKAAGGGDVLTGY